MAGGFDKHPENINREGAPKKEWTFAGVFREELEKCGDDKVKLKRNLAKAMMKKAKEGDVQAFKEIANRVDGLPKQNLDLTSGGERIGLFDFTKQNEDRQNNSDNEIAENDEKD